MAGAFSGHLVNSYNANQTTPFTADRPPILTSGPLSFNPQMHGTPIGRQSMTDASFSFKSEPSFLDSGLSDATTNKIAALQAKLNQKLGPEYISQRPGPGGGPKLSYAEGWKIINLANEVFGFNGWSSNVVSLTTDFIDFNEETRRYTIGATAIMRVTLRDGVFHEDIGYGMLENSKSKGQALDKCKKEAVTDGLKRALRNFGNLLGNCLYDKSYIQEVTKIKVPPPKFDKNELHRRPEFEERKPASTSTSATSSTSNPLPDVKPNIMMTPVKPPAAQQQLQANVLSSIPAHIRSEIHAPGTSSNHQNSSPVANDTTTPSTKGKARANTGLNTPITTPVHGSTVSASRQPPPVVPPQAQRERRVSFAQPSTTTSHVANNANTTANPTTSSTARNNKSSPPPAPVHVPPSVKADPEPADPDDSYQFDSDDDAFLAVVDLGEGQPVLVEADFGRPIDTDDGLGTPIYWGEGSGGEDVTLGGSGAGNGNDNGVEAGAKEGKRLDIQSGQTSSEATSGIGLLSKLLPQNPQHTNRNSDPTNNNPRPPSHTVNQRPRYQPLHHQQQNQHLKPKYSPPQNQNQAPAQVGNAPGSSSTAKRPPTPSMGGFHFPSEVNTHHQQAPPQRNRQSSASGSGSSSGLGLKRPLDNASNSSFVNTAQRRPGMGLDTHAGAGSGQAKREVFAELDIAESGDVKRMRR